ncbi:MAG: hypothetical protein M3O70_08250 [Actinomycetota bacterium]|nr:hypothetical protein [Actinomycetota bacterium]
MIVVNEAEVRQAFKAVSDAVDVLGPLTGKVAELTAGAPTLPALSEEQRRALSPRLAFCRCRCHHDKEQQ